MKAAVFWGKIIFILSISAVMFLIFDFQMVPMFMRVVRNAQAEQKAKLVETPLPEAVAFEAWDDEPDLSGFDAQDDGAEAGEPSFKVSDKTTGPVITITSQPLGAKIMFNEKFVGTTPFEGALNLDEATRISLSMPGYFPESRTVKPESSRRLKFLFQLKPIESTTASKVHFKSVSNDVPHTTDGLVEMDLSGDDETPAQDVSENHITPPDVSSLKQTRAPSVSRPVQEVKKQLKGNLALLDDEFFTVQVESMKDYKDASFKVALYQAMGFPAFVCSAELVDKGTWYRVRLGRFSTKAEAQKLASKVAKQTAAVPWVVQEDGLCPKLVSATPWETP